MTCKVKEQAESADMDDEKTSQKASRPRLAWQTLRVSWWLLAVPVLFVLIIAVSLIDRDITAPSWVKSRLEARAAAMLGGGALQFGDIIVNIGRDLHPNVRLVDAVLTDADGAPIAQVAEINGQLSPRGVLFEQTALMQNVSVTGANIAIRRDRDGTIAVAFAGADRAETAPDFAALLDQFDQAFDAPALAALETASLNGLVINYTDVRAGRHWTVDSGALALDLRGNQTDLRGAFSLLSGGTQVTNLALSFVSPRGTRAAQIGVDMTGALAGDLATQSAALNWLAAVDAPLSGNLRTTLDENGNLGPMSATLALGQGALQPTPQSKPLGFSDVKAYLTYDPNSDKIAFSEVSLVSDFGRFRASGQALLREVANGLPAVLLGQFRFQDAEIAAGQVYAEPLALAGGAVDFRLRLDPFQIDLGQVVLSDPAMPVVASGQVRATPLGWTSAIDIDVAEIASDQVLALWPPSFIAVVRDWLGAYVETATLRDVRVGWRSGPDRSPQVAGGFTFADTKMRFLRDLPPIEDGHGIAHFTNTTFGLTLEKGQMRAPEGGQITMDGSSMMIPNVGSSPSRMEVALDLQSTVTAITTVIERPPLRLMSRGNLPQVLADGRARTQGTLQFPIKTTLTPTEVAFDFTSDLRAVRSDRLVPGRRLDASRLSLGIRNGLLEATGNARLDGVPLRGTFTRALDAGGAADLQAQVALDQAFLSAFGISLPSGMVSGSGTGDLTVRFANDVSPRYELRSDLRGLAVALPQVGWRKSPNTAGVLQISGALGPRPNIERLTMSGAGLSASGRVSMNAQGGLDAARFDRVRVGNWLDAPITLRGRGNGRPVGVDIAGGRLDLRSARFGGSGDGGPMSLRLDRLQITEGIHLSDFRGDFSGTGGFSGQFTGNVNGIAAVQGTVVPQSGRSAVRIQSDDAGGVARATGLLKDARGGTLDLTLQPNGNAGNFDGNVAIRKLRVRNASAMAQLLDAISVVGLLQQLDGQGIAFDEVDAQFRLTPDRVILTQSSAVGPGLGISLDGIYTLANKTLEMQGVVSPFYLINSIGSIFTRRGEGLIGFSFTVDGDAAAPQVNVNPLSALTPGMFREIFRRSPPQVTQ